MDTRTGAQYITLLFLFLNCFLSCQTKASTDEQLRRYCFVTYNLEKHRALPNFMSNPNYTQIIDKSGIKKIGIFNKDNIGFIIIDSAPSLSYDDLKERVRELPEARAIGDILNLNSYQLIQRIFNMPLDDNLDPKKGQLVNERTDFSRIVMTLEIVNDLLLKEEYISIHRSENFWPQVIDNMKTIGIHDMELYLHGYQAFLIMDTRPGFDLTKDGEKWAKLPKEQEWQEYAGKFQKVDPKSQASEKWEIMNALK